jgi:hypothetical protein
MKNLLPNAGFLDLTEGWTVTGGPTLSVDESGKGAPGRAVLRAAGNASVTGSVVLSASRRPAAASGQTWAAACSVVARVAGVEVTPTVRLAFKSSGGGSTGTAAAAVRPAELSASGLGVHGLRQTFLTAEAGGVAPASTASATIEIVVPVTSGQSVEILLLKPVAGIGPITTGWVWDPGDHTAVDLQRPAWPDGLRPFRRGPGSQPKAWSHAFDAATGRPAQRRQALDPARRFDGTMRCDAVQRALLETFHRTTPRGFWFVEPDSDRLCVADFADDGAPSMTDAAGPTSIMSVGLWLETA